MILTTRTRGLLRRTLDVVARSWGQGNYAMKAGDRYQYCLMGGVLRATGIPGKHMVPYGADDLPYEFFSDMPKEAQPAIKALAIKILVEHGWVSANGYVANHLGRPVHFGCGPVSEADAERYVERHPDSCPDIIACFNDSLRTTKSDVKGLLRGLLND